MNNKLTSFDILLILTLLGVSFFFIYRNHFGISTVVEIYEEGRTRSLDISRDTTITLKESFIIEIKSRKIRVVSSDCPKKVCRHLGWISRPGDTIVCVPGRIAVVIRGKEPYDALSR